jgi:hypothetical protein
MRFAPARTSGQVEPRRRSGIVVVVATVAGLLAGCGGASAVSSGGRPSTAKFEAQFVGFAGCMRSHGLPSYPDPRFASSGDGEQVRISPGSLDPNSPAFRSADAACHHLLPNGGSGASNGAISAQARAREVGFADCLRAHGVPDFPDPDRDGAFTLPSGLDPQAPQVQRAIQACASVEPSSLVINQAAPSG